MSLFAALTTAVGGLAAQSSSIGNVSDNLANTQTVGYKTISTHFESLVTQSTATTNDPGGVRATPTYENSSQGSLVESSASTSLAISGSGYFPVRQAVVNADGTTAISSTTYYTRAGDFTLNSSGYLVNGSGYYLTGYSVDSDGDVDTSSTSAIQISALLDNPVATSTVNYAANLPSSVASTVASPYTSSESTLQIYDSLGGTHTLSFTWTKASSDSQATTTYTDGIALTAKTAGTDGNSITSTLTYDAVDGYTLTIISGSTQEEFTVPTTSTDVWGDLVAQVNGTATGSTASTLVTAATDGDGTATLPDAGTPSISLPAFTGGLDSGANTNIWYLSVTVEGGGGVDGSGNAADYTATIPFTFNSTTNSGTIASIGNSSSSGASGTYTVTSTGAAEVTLPLSFLGSGLTGTQSVTIDFGNYNSSSNALTQFADSDNTVSVSSFDQNGIPRGSFESLSIDENGFVSLNYDNGQTRIIAQIPIVQFFAEDELQRITGGVYAQTLSSGTARYSVAGTNGAGTIVSGALESSTVDIATEFTKLIQAQRVYSANAKTITAADDMLQEVINIIK